MMCPFCQSPNIRVIDKRSTGEGQAIRRRRECESCNKRFTTYERIESPNIYIIKKDGRREPFDRAKLEKGIIRACEKRPISMDSISRVVDNIQSRLMHQDSVEISSSEVGKAVMQELKKIDKIAYIRFASVYKQFKDIESMQKEIEKIS